MFLVEDKVREVTFLANTESGDDTFRAIWEMVFLLRNEDRNEYAQPTVDQIKNLFSHSQYFNCKLAGRTNCSLINSW